jgi:hypothetical protein
MGLKLSPMVLILFKFGKLNPCDNFGRISIQVLVFSENYKSGPSSFKFDKNGPCANGKLQYGPRLSNPWKFLPLKYFGELPKPTP